ncbi:hypothetical protein B0A48_09937 [Cryoendolithus antarcticus]|uniref:Elongation of fatty acids protein n=1 Tax=Cryoendolithus antarcticus TaxID=1507870 RepID=A0A1V8T3U3_9PEZI|nr:hypothetical protein B0A48_09937 [Cryoendolithus antarcticus]
MSGPSVYLTLPDRHLFKFPPANLPPTLPPPDKERTFRAPFGVTTWLYNVAMRWEVPVTFALIYVTSVFILNAYNRRHGNQPWWIAKQKFFKAFVVVHNVVLALYSAATFFAMFRAIVHTWPGLNNPNGLAGVADSLCKIHGPRGLGDAVTYNSTINIWESKNQLVHTSPLGLPIESDVGRLWNEGLAFWGWIFYLSKFYEVLDTFIIVAKGKRSPTLQTYHHAGAMLCMWAGIRYMSPPIWMFVFINSFIHALMYTYFTATALDIKVNKSIKRSLTTMQIAQFVFGASYAAIHLFVKYDIPVTTPYQVVAPVASVVSHITSAVTSATSEISHVAVTSSPTASLAAVIKKYLLRAAGEEGVAERVGIARNVNQPVADAIKSQQQSIAERAQAPVEPMYETRYRTEYKTVNCIDTSGEAFAVYLNFLYLLPLTVLFLRFFYKAYVARVRRNSSIAEAAKGIPKDAGKAKQDTEHAIEDAGESVEDKIPATAEELERRKEQLREDVKKMKDGTFRDRRVSERVQSFEGKAKSQLDKTKDAISNAGSPRRSSPTKKGNDETSGGANGQGSDQNESKPSYSAGEDGQSKASANDDKENQAPSSDSQPSKPANDNVGGKPQSSTEDSKLSQSGGDAGKPSTDKSSQQTSGKGKGDSEKDKKPSSSDNKSQAQDKNEQDANIGDSQALRPGTGDSGTGSDSNAPAPSSLARPSSPTKKPTGSQSRSPSPAKKSAASQDRPASPSKKPAPSRLPSAKDSKGAQGKDGKNQKDDKHSNNSSPSKKQPAKLSGKPTAETKKVPAKDQSEKAQDAALEATSATRPEPDSPDLFKHSPSGKSGSKQEDSDAMGKSGIDIDHSDADDKADKSGGAEDSAQPDMGADVSERAFAEDAAQTFKPPGGGKK